MTPSSKTSKHSPSTIIFIIAALMIFVIAVMIIGVRAKASALYPPLSFLASDMGITKGQPLPKGVIWNGRPYYFYIEDAQERPGGKYTVELQAR
jgi:hypothetical protein